MSTLSAIWAVIEARLTAIVPPGGRVTRDPSGDLEPGTELALMTGRITRIKGETGSVRRRVSFSVQGSCSGDDEAALKLAIVDLHADTVDALTGEQTLGDLVETLEDTDGSFATVPLSDVRILTFDQAFDLEFTAQPGRLSNPT